MGYVTLIKVKSLETAGTGFTETDRQTDRHRKRERKGGTGARDRSIER